MRYFLIEELKNGSQWEYHISEYGSLPFFGVVHKDQIAGYTNDTEFYEDLMYTALGGKEVYAQWNIKNAAGISWAIVTADPYSIKNATQGNAPFQTYHSILSTSPTLGATYGLTQSVFPYQMTADKLKDHINGNFKSEPVIKNCYAHVRKTYTGFTQVFDYCDVCGKKESEW